MEKINNLPGFLIIACGGAGIRILEKIRVPRSDHVRSVATDTDTRVLEKSCSDVKIPLGITPVKTTCEGDRDQAANAVGYNHSAFVSLIKPSEIVWIIAGMGGNTGSCAAPQIARIARDRGALVIALCILPVLPQVNTFRKAKAGCKELLQYADSVLVVDNDYVCSGFDPVLSIREQFAKINMMVAEMISSLLNSFYIPSLINVDPDDFNVIFRNKGVATILAGESGAEVVNKNDDVVRECLAHPLFNTDYRTATGCLVLIAGGKDLGLFDTEEIATSVSWELDPHADVVWCSDIQSSMEGKLRVYAIMTGIRWGR
jgi:cell division protein FtsZ